VRHEGIGMSGLDHLWMGLILLGLAAATFVTRTSFLLAGSRIKLHPRAESALRFAPVCTLAAIVVPEVLLHGQTSIDVSLVNPRLIGVAGAALWLCFSRNIVGCMAAGMLAFSLARILL
jgi:branched-subunit amino acid transport protein